MVQTHVQGRGSRRLQRAAKWTGLAACVLIAAMYAASVKHIFGATYLAGQTYERSVWTHLGAIEYHCASCPGDPAPLGLNWTFQRWGVGSFPWLPRWRFGRSDQVVIPLWLPFTVAAIPTAVLFYRDRPAARRAREGKCVTCGYDLRGLAPGAPCPECGRARSSVQAPTT